MSVGERIRHELREVGLVTLYFLACFLFFLTLKWLLLAEYRIATAVVGQAIVGALVVAKVVVLLDKTRLGDLLGSSRRALRVLWRSGVYTALVFAVTFAERWLDIYREQGGALASLVRTWREEDVYHFLALNLTVGLCLLVYNVFAEIGRHVGASRLRALFFGERDPERAKPSLEERPTAP